MRERSLPVKSAGRRGVVFSTGGEPNIQESHGGKDGVGAGIAQKSGTGEKSKVSGPRGNVSRGALSEERFRARMEGFTPHAIMGAISWSQRAKGKKD